jgi:Ca2+-binding EF-hand superfamily protein
MTVNEFKSVFHDKIGNFIVNDNINLMNKLYNYCDGKLSEFIQVLQNIDTNKTGKINLHDFVKSLKEKNLLFKNINHNNIIEQNSINDAYKIRI